MIPSKTNFLIVDDIANVRKMLKEQLKEFGFKGDFLEAASVEEGKKLLEQQVSLETPVGFILCDYLMPNQTGIELLKFVRSAPNFKNIPFIMVTTESEKQAVIGAISNGVSGYITKPWTGNVLKEKIAVAWEKMHPT